MANSEGRSIRQTLVGSALAGLVAVVVLSVMAALNLGPSIVQFAVALVLGVIVAQLYESRQ